jgi:Fe2+ transport system protein FeoA
MRISESATREWTLATVGVGEPVEILAVLGSQADELRAHGLRPGARVAIEGDAPFGGPRLVRVGRARVAVDRRLARSIAVRPECP